MLTRVNRATYSAAPIHSEFQDDEEFHPLLEEFQVSVRHREQVMKSAFRLGCFQDVRMHAHQLKGAGGGYGFQGLSELCAVLEAACQDPVTDAEQIGRLLDDVVDYMARIEI